MYRVGQCYEVDVQSAPFFVNSSLAPVLLFRRRLKSVADVLKGIREHGFTQTRWYALQIFWAAVCRHGPCGPACSSDPWDGWVPPDLHGFYKWVFDALDIFKYFHYAGSCQSEGCWVASVVQLASGGFRF